MQKEKIGLVMTEMVKKEDCKGLELLEIQISNKYMRVTTHRLMFVA